MSRFRFWAIVLVVLLVGLHQSAAANLGKNKSSPVPRHKQPSTRKKQAPGSPPAPGCGNQHGNSNIFNVLSFGAKGDGLSNDGKAFQSAWLAACSVESSVVEVPAGHRFLVGPISFSGPCQQNIIFQIDGTVIAPVSPRVWGSGSLEWIQFTKLRAIAIQGSGLIDGRGAPWWALSDYDLIVSSKRTKGMPSMRPTALRFYGSYNVTVQGITIQNSPQCHLKFDSCSSVEVAGVTISSPGNSPNTDGIHLQNCQDVEIHHSTMACGDDCVSIQTGCSDIRVHNINCGPGHGIRLHIHENAWEALTPLHFTLLVLKAEPDIGLIYVVIMLVTPIFRFRLWPCSIGGLGRDQTKACVSNVTVYDVAVHDAETGVRIKTWQGGSGSVRGVWFSNVQVTNVRIPIVIDQFYCDKRICYNQTLAIDISEVTYENIRGTYALKAVHLACSDNVPCTDVSLTDIELQPVAPICHEPFCWNSYGLLQPPSIPPVYCLQVGNPNKRGGRIQSNYDGC